jgi:hypothetical protein
MTRREVGSQILTLVNQKPELTIPASAVANLMISAKQQLQGGVNEWAQGGSSEPLKGALFLLETAGAISQAELEKLTDLIDDTE